MQLRGKRVVITGKLSRPRKEVVERLAEHGAIVVSDVSARTDLLVVGEKPGSKLPRAQELGIEVITERDLEVSLGRWESDEQGVHGTTSAVRPSSPVSVSTAGGPVLVLPGELAECWEGSFEPSPGRIVEADSRWDGPQRAATDYDRALDALGREFMVGGLPVGDGWGVVLRNEFVEVIEHRGHVVLQSTALDDLERLADDEGEAMWHYSPHALTLRSGRLVVVDAAARAADLPREEGGARDARLVLQLEPGVYAVDRCCRYWPGRREEVLAARLRKVDGEVDVAFAQRPTAIAGRDLVHRACRDAQVRAWWQVGAYVRDRVRVEVLKKAPRQHGAVGATRFGGLADLSTAEDWPNAPGFDFCFLAQIHLADLAPYDVGHRLPPSGLLSFFCATEAVVGMQTEVDSRRPARVLYFPQGTPLEPFWRSWGAPKMRGMRFELSPAPPLWNSQLIGNDDPAYCDVYDALERADRERPRTALFGFDRVYEEELAPNEEMLLSVWCNEDVDYPFVESVSLCFAIDRGALRRGDFSQVRCWESGSI